MMQMKNILKITAVVLAAIAIGQASQYWLLVNTSGHVSYAGGVYTQTGGNGASGNIWNENPLAHDTTWNIVFENHGSSYWTCLGIQRESYLATMQGNPSGSHYWQGNVICIDTSQGRFENGSFIGGNNDQSVGQHPVREQNTGAIYTLTYSGDSFVIDDLASGGNSVRTWYLDPTETWIPFVSMHSAGTALYFDNIDFGECITWGNECLMVEEIQECHNHLGLLSADTDSVDNVCEDRAENGITLYEFTLSYNSPFFLHDCLEQRVYFEGTEILEGTAEFDEYNFNPDTQEVKFQVKHLELESYGCILAVSDEDYEWTCNSSLDILFAGVVQYTYEFHMIVTLSRVYEDTLDVTVQKNNVVGDCCENELNIQTQLQWCEDFTCNSYLPNPLTIERKADIFVEHSIVNQEFQYYFLHGMSIKLGPFIPQVIATDGSQPGRYIYHFISNVAMGNMQLEVISRIDENPEVRRLLSGGRRSLGATDQDQVEIEYNEEGVIQNPDEAEMRDDYKVKATEYITIKDVPNEMESGNKKSQKEESSNTGLIIGMVVLGCVLLGGAIGGTVFYLKKREGKQAQEEVAVKYQQKNDNSASSETGRRLSINSDQVEPIQISSQ